MISTSIQIDIESFRKDGESRWLLPPWSHPLSQGVLPLFIIFNEKAYPIGTAFTVGRGVTFAVTAAHNIREAWKREPRLTKLLVADTLPASISLKEAGISLLYQQPGASSAEIRFAFWPFETIEGMPPSDLVIGFPQFQTQFSTLVNKISFDLPRIGQTVWSIGYAKMTPQEILIDDIRTGRFNLLQDYTHQFTVVEGKVDRLFTQRFAAGYVEGPCFTFDAEIDHGQSGGPVMTPAGVIIGINSAAATMFLDRPTSIGCPLYPMFARNLRFGAQIGPVRMNATRPLFDLIATREIVTDGSEESVALRPDGAGSFAVCPRVPIADAQFIHDDFAGYRAGLKATAQTEPVFRLRRIDSDSAF
jgi:hypothetical protein